MNKNLAILLFCVAGLCVIVLLFYAGELADARRGAWLLVATPLAIIFAIGLASFVGGNMLLKKDGGNLIACSECGASISAKAEACLKCGAPITEADKERMAEKIRLNKIVSEGLAEADAKNKAELIAMCKEHRNYPIYTMVVGAGFFAFGVWGFGGFIILAALVWKVAMHLYLEHYDK